MEKKKNNIYIYIVGKHEKLHPRTKAEQKNESFKKPSFYTVYLDTVLMKVAWFGCSFILFKSILYLSIQVSSSVINIFMGT